MPSQRPWLSLMQDNASFHPAFRTTEELNESYKFPIIWPSNSPDSNVVENVWNLMKDFTKIRYSDLSNGKLRTQNQPRNILHEAWDFIAVDGLRETHF